MNLQKKEKNLIEQHLSSPWRKKNNNYLLYFLLITKSFIELPPSSIYWLLKKIVNNQFSEKKCLRNETRPQNFRHFLRKEKESSLHYLESYTHVLKNLKIKI